MIINCTQQEVPEGEKTLFTVNGIETTVFDFEARYVSHLIKTGRNDTKSERYAFINEMIDNLLLAEKAADEGYLTDEIYKSAIKFQQRKSMVDLYFVDEMDKRLEAPTDEEMRLAFAKSKRKVYVRHLYSKREAELYEPYQRLVQGEDFVDVANDYYETEAYDSLAGYLGPISYFGVDDSFAEAAFSTNQGEFTKPVRSKFGYHIIFMEYIEFPAMLAEDEYQYRKQGMRSKVRLKKQEIISNEYIRNLMENLLVEVDRQNVLDLKETIASLTTDTSINQEQGINPESQSDFWKDSRLDELRAAFDGEAVLASYVLGGERTEFTFYDYLNWLPYLSFSESKARTGASVGRALRNEVLYQLAEKQDYADDSRVKKEVRQRGYEVLSQLYQRQIMQEALNDTASATAIPAGYRDRLIRNKEYQLVATYWRVKAASMQDARAIKDEIISGTAPESYESFMLYEDKNVLPEENYYSLVRDGLIQQPTVAHSGVDGWIVLSIQSRKITEIDKETDQDQLVIRYKVFDYLRNTVSKLREKAEVEVDTALFNDIYALYKKKEAK